MKPIYDITSMVVDGVAHCHHTFNLNHVTHITKRDDTPKCFVVHVIGSNDGISLVFNTKESRDELYQDMCNALLASDDPETLDKGKREDGEARND